MSFLCWARSEFLLCQHLLRFEAFGELPDFPETSAFTRDEALSKASTDCFDLLDFFFSRCYRIFVCEMISLRS